MLRKLIILLLGISCMALAAQEVPNALAVYQRSGAVATFAIEGIDSIAFPDQMEVCMKSGTLYRFAKADVDSMGLITLPTSELYESVDLGLSVRWAVCNIGAIRSEDYGGLYAWGETTEKEDYSESNYLYFQNDQYQIIGVNICGTKYDVARQQWGGEWRLPTRSEINELATQCQWTHEVRNGVSGFRITAQNGNSIFLPAAGFQKGSVRESVGTDGFYWTGNVNRNMLSSAYNINFRGYDADWSASRAYGFSVRAVR